MVRKVFILLLAVLLLGSAAAEEVVIEPAYPVSEDVTRLLAIAAAEVGYEEYDHGQTKYGVWAGDPYAQWCAEYLNWCVDQVDQQYGTELLNTVWPRYSGTNTGRDWFIRKGRYIARNGNVSGWGYQWLKGEDHFLKAGDYIPQPGDWVFFTWTDNTDTDHVAMVEYCTRDDDGNVTIHVLEGNNPVRVQRNTYDLTYNRILGFGLVNDAMDITMRMNCVGDKVQEFQEKLAYLGYLTERTPTGTYGPYTAAAVRTIQKKYDLKVTGIATLQVQQYVNAEWQEAIATDPSFWLVIDDEEDDE